MADKGAGLHLRLLADVLNQLTAHDRLDLVQHLNDGMAHARIVEEQQRDERRSLSITLRQVEVHFLAAICHLELAAGALGLDPLKPPRTRPRWRRWAWWRQ